MQVDPEEARHLVVYLTEGITPIEWAEGLIAATIETSVTTEPPDDAYAWIGRTARACLAELMNAGWTAPDPDMMLAKYGLRRRVSGDDA